MPRQTPRQTFGDTYQSTALGGFFRNFNKIGPGDIAVQFAQSGSFTNAATIPITPYDTDVAIGSATLNVTSAHDIILIGVHVNGSFAHLQPGDQTFVKIVRTLGPTTILFDRVDLTAQANLDASGDFSFALVTFDINVTGNVTYNYYMRLHHGGAGAFAVTAAPNAGTGFGGQIGFAIDFLRGR